MRKGKAFALRRVGRGAVNRDDDADERRIAAVEPEAVVEQPRFADVSLASVRPWIAYQ